MPRAIRYTRPGQLAKLSGWKKPRSSPCARPSLNTSFISRPWERSAPPEARLRAHPREKERAAQSHERTHIHREPRQPEQGHPFGMGLAIIVCWPTQGFLEPGPRLHCQGGPMTCRHRRSRHRPACRVATKAGDFRLNWSKFWNATAQPKTLVAAGLRDGGRSIRHEGY
jgi:hypothetical protein